VQVTTLPDSDDITRFDGCIGNRLEPTGTFCRIFHQVIDSINNLLSSSKGKGGGGQVNSRGKGVLILLTIPLYTVM
jgi:hypothetical protein